MKRAGRNWKIAVPVVVMGLLIFYFFSVPSLLFHDPYSTVLQAHDGNLLSASIAKDGQWRFPETDSVPSKFAQSLITFEDKRFLTHPGLDVLSLGRALRQNIKSGKVVSGGSTITMQVIRLSRKGQPRTFLEKTIELILSTRLELRYSKEQILGLYASHAPFGGNVVGLEAACWRYFGTDPLDLSWAQAALLAVLPNSPSLIHPGKNRNFLKIKRDKLLDKLKDSGWIDDITCTLAKEEIIPDAPQALPRHARHLLARISQEGFAGKKVLSTVDYNYQQRIEQILNDHVQRLKTNGIHNGAALVLDVKTGNALAYVGNVDGTDSHENEVDVITSSRSTGSILKPFLYAAMMDEGKLLQKTLLPDVPLLINGFSPKNFTHVYDGAVHADKALIRSLNVPAVHMLKDYRYEKFHTLLRNLGMNTLNRPPDHYGLSLILGGAEGKLWDITGMYASMARTLTNYFEHPGKRRYNKNDFHEPVYLKSIVDSIPTVSVEQNSWLSAASIFLTFETLKELYRPGEESGWRHFSSSRTIAWKTGTSFGFRDGWAIGVTPDFVVGVWVGNADGEGRPGLTGSDAAAPIMFDIFSQLPGKAWFQQPLTEMQKIIVCEKSGHRASPLCVSVDTVWVSNSGLISAVCSYHKTVHLTPDLKYQVHDACFPMSNMKHVNWFILPPVQEHYFKSVNLSYKSLPPFRNDCVATERNASMEMVYPKNKSRLFIPRELDGTPGSSVFQLAHTNPSTTIFWHLDGKYIGSTKKIHDMAFSPGEGEHTLTAVDDQGQVLVREFKVISKL